MGIMKQRWMELEEELLDAFRLGQITRQEFIRQHEERLNYSPEEAERYANETAEFLEEMSRRV